MLCMLCVVYLWCCCFFNQKTAYEMRISDWSSTCALPISAYMMDTVGNKVAKSEIAQIKVVAPNVALKVIDRAILIHGGAGVSNDFPLAYMYAMQRTPLGRASCRERVCK